MNPKEKAERIRDLFKVAHNALSEASRIWPNGFANNIDAHYPFAGSLDDIAHDMQIFTESINDYISEFPPAKEPFWTSGPSKKTSWKRGA